MKELFTCPPRAAHKRTNTPVHAWRHDASLAMPLRAAVGVCRQLALRPPRRCFRSHGNVEVINENRRVV
jgi:hypothetical protein